MCAGNPEPRDQPVRLEDRLIADLNTLTDMLHDYPGLVADRVLSGYALPSEKQMDILFLLGQLKMRLRGILEVLD